MQDLEYLGSETLPVGQYGFNISCPSYLKALDTTGWTATGQDSGTISGMVYLVNLLPVPHRKPMLHS